MTGIITKRFRLFAAEQFKELFDEAVNDTVYIFVGKTNPWPDDNNPPAPIDSVGSTEYSIWNSMVSAKKIDSNDVTFAAIRNNWTSGQVYQKYTIDTEFQAFTFFVLTDEYNVYKCMDNNNGAPSTTKPTGRLTSVFTTSDKYKWKFMGEISAADAVKYVTTGYIPVKTITSDDSSFQWNVQQAAVNGSIDTVQVVSGGVNYITNTGVVVSSNTTKISVSTSANSTNGVYVGSSIYITAGPGAGQKRLISGYSGSGRLATVSPAFSTAPTAASAYIISPTISVTSGDGSSFSAYPTVSNGAIRTVEVINKGLNYSRATLTVTANTGSGASLLSNISPIGGHGSNPVYELNGHNVMMFVKFSGSEGGAFFSNNDFRIVGVVTNPKLANGSLATDISYLVSPKLTITSPNGTFLPDETILGATSGATGTFIEYDTLGNLIITNVIGTFVNETITSGTSGVTATVTAVTPSPLRPYSGSVIYVENRPPIVRSINQEENFRLVITL